MLGLDGVLQVAHRCEDLLGALRDGRFAVRRDIVDLLLASCDGITVGAARRRGAGAGRPPDRRSPTRSAARSPAKTRSSCRSWAPRRIDRATTRTTGRAPRASTPCASPPPRSTSCSTSSARPSSTPAGSSAPARQLDVLADRAARDGCASLRQAGSGALDRRGRPRARTGCSRSATSCRPRPATCASSSRRTRPAGAGARRCDGPGHGAGTTRRRRPAARRARRRRRPPARTSGWSSTARTSSWTSRCSTASPTRSSTSSSTPSTTAARRRRRGSRPASPRRRPSRSPRAQRRRHRRARGRRRRRRHRRGRRCATRRSRAGCCPPTRRSPAPRCCSVLFTPGVLHRREVTETSGRGVGLDVVRTAVEALGGSSSSAATPGAGTTFALTLPVTLGVLRCLIARVGDERYALPVPGVVESLSLKDADVHALAGQAGRRAPRRDAAAARPRRRARRARRRGEATGSAVVVRHADRQVAWAVDRLEGELELVVKDLGPFLGRLPLVSRRHHRRRRQRRLPARPA